MIVVRCECDAHGCGRHFIVPGHELRPTVHTATRGGATVLLGLSLVGLPATWIAEDSGRVVSLYCAEHAEHLIG